MIELNLDGLVGPTHHYAGLSKGNIASMNHALTFANPKAAALQGLNKMKFMHAQGVKQAFLPPHYRPHLPLLNQLGFEGNRHAVIEKAYTQTPQLLSAAFSASNMWTANAATVTSHLDSLDGKTHFTAANLNTNVHRHIEAPFNEKLLQLAFADEVLFKHHPALPSSAVLGDEGAANHTRLGQHDRPGIHLFVFGQQSMGRSEYALPKRYWARQTLEASEQIALTHGLNKENTLFACQSPDIIDQGVFHNDVICVGNENLILLHEQAFVNQADLLGAIEQKSQASIHIEVVKQAELTVAEAVSTYLFNSQLVTLPNQDGMLLVAPQECEDNAKTNLLIQQWLSDKHCPIIKVKYFDLKQSMMNGGGPACLRLRVPLDEARLQSMHPGFLIDEQKIDDLENWVNKHYRDRLSFDELRDPDLINEVEMALDALSGIMGLPKLYPFQQ